MFLLLDTTQWPGKGKTVDPLETKPDSIWIRRANRVGGRLGPAPAILPIVATHDASNFPDLSRYKTVSFIANAQQRDHCVFKTRKVRKRPRTRSPDRLKVETRPTESVCCDNRVMVTYVFPYAVAYIPRFYAPAYWCTLGSLNRGISKRLDTFGESAIFGELVFQTVKRTNYG